LELLDLLLVSFFCGTKTSSPVADLLSISPPWLYSTVRTIEGRQTAALNLIEQGIDSLVVCGGDGSLTGADFLRKEWSGIVKFLLEQGTPFLSSLPVELVSARFLSFLPNLLLLSVLFLLHRQDL